MNDFDFMTQMNYQNQMEIDRMNQEHVDELARNTQMECVRLDQQTIEELNRNQQLIQEQQMRKLLEMDHDGPAADFQQLETLLVMNKIKKLVSKILKKVKKIF